MGGLWEQLRGERIFLTGATGFFGCWLLETFIHANEKLQLGATLVALTRDATAFKRKAPHVANHHAIQYHEGDVRNFAFPEGAFSFVIHAATEASTTLNESSPLAMFDTIVEGTRRVLDFSRHSKARRVLYISSGAVYGRQPPTLANVGEDYAGAPDLSDPRSTYGESKRMAELLCAIYHRHHNLDTAIARCFAFVGPYLPLDSHFAAGNFIRDALNGTQINVNGDGTPYRSYLYTTDLAVWLWTLLFKGAPGRAYNVGSDEALSIAETARAVAKTFNPARTISIALTAAPDKVSERYVPSVERAKRELGLTVTVPAGEAFRRTVAWHSTAGHQ